MRTGAPLPASAGVACWSPAPHTGAFCICLPNFHTNHCAATTSPGFQLRCPLLRERCPTHPVTPISHPALLSSHHLSLNHLSPVRTGDPWQEGLCLFASCVSCGSFRGWDTSSPGSSCPRLLPQEDDNSQFISDLVPKLTHATAEDLAGHFPPKKSILSGSRQHPLLSSWLPSLTTSHTPAIQTSPDSVPRRPTFVVSLLWNALLRSGFSLRGPSRCHIFREEPSVNATPTQSHPPTSWFHQPLPGILFSLLPK